MPKTSYCGILNINKPPEITSRRVVDVVQRLVRPAKVGHGGTLDPMATGVLVVCVGSATRLIPYVQQGRKEYRAEFLLGSHSNTDDITGEVQTVQDVTLPSMDEIRAVLPKFIGDIQQIPPQFSAVHIDGQRAYKLARAGKEVQLQPRTVQVHHIEVIDYAAPKLELLISCGSGTYIRSIGRDLGQELGCGAVMSKLVRTRVGPFELSQSINLAELSPETLTAAIKPSLLAVDFLPQYVCSAEELAMISNGRPLHPSSGFEAVGDTPIALVGPEEQLAANAAS